MRWIPYLLALLFFSPQVVSQMETSQWYFGNQCGLNFATNPPTVIPSPAFNSVEGGASIADASGNLLFYTDGVTVWGNTHAVMANGNGLFGSKSSTQSSIIIKQPGSASLYYLFTQEEKGNANGFRYSVIDMSLAAGMGSVTTKNILITTSSCEKLSAVKHCNGSDVWIVTHDYNSDVFRSVLLTSAGLNTIPVLSATGPVLSGMNYNSVLKISPNGKKIAIPSLMGNSLRLFDFNTSTGIVSNHVILSTIVSYGCEFSPDGTKLYAGVDNIYQWDLCAGNTAAIQNSSVTLFVNSLISMSSFQLAPDGKIYIGKLQTNSLAVINNPDLSGTACNFNVSGPSMGTGTVTLGLPNFMVSYFKTSPAFSASQNCTAFTFTAPPLPVSDCSAAQSFTAISWLFSDAASGAANTSTLPVPTHNFSGPGVYKVKLLLYTECGADTVSKDVIIPAGPSLTILSAGTVCAGSPATMIANGADTYSWSTGATTSSLVVFPVATSIYTVTGSLSNGCQTSTTAIISVKPAGTPTLDFLYKNPVCINDTDPLPQLNGGFNTGGIFSSADLTLDAASGLIDLKEITPGTFTVNYSVSPKECVLGGSHTTSVEINAAPVLSVSPDIKIGPGFVITLSVTGASSYTWETLAGVICSDCPEITVSPALSTRYCAVSHQAGCVAEACVNVEVGCDGKDLSLPNAFSPNGDGYNDAFCLQGWDLCTDHFSVLIFNRWGEKVFESNDPSFCWDGSYNGKISDPEVYIYNITASFSTGLRVDRKGNITLLK